MSAGFSAMNKSARITTLVTGAEGDAVGDGRGGVPVPAR
jgi:hypothetical protein